MAADANRLVVSGCMSVDMIGLRYVERHTGGVETDK